MVYSNKFVAVVVCKGQIVRELREDEKDVVRLPFGSDYSIRLKNLHSERAVVNIEIDGQDVLGGSQIVVSPNETADIEGFMEGSTVRKKFRFIEKTQKIFEHRGDYVEDGIIRVSYQFEKPKPPFRSYPHHWERRYGRRHGDIMRGMCNIDHPYTARPCASQGITEEECADNVAINAFDKTLEKYGKPEESEDGITVAGADTYQNFNTTYVGALEPQTHSIVIRILGQTKAGKKFHRPKITRRKVSCPTCGTRNRSRVRYCSDCGTNISDVV